MKPVEPTRKQIEICNRYNSSVVPYRNDERVAVALSSIAKNPIVGMRNIPQPGEDVTWFFHCGEQSQTPGFYSPLHIDHLKDYIPEVLDYLCLEPGYGFIIDREGYEDIWKLDEDQAQ